MFVASNITPQNEIFKELTNIQCFLDSEYPSDIPGACTERLDHIQIHMARSGKLLADAEYHLHTLMASEIAAAIKGALNDKLQTTTLNKYLDAVCRDYKYLVTWGDRLNRCLTHQGEQMRTIISNHKAQMLSYGSGRD